MSGNLARRRQTKCMPADFNPIEARQPPLSTTSGSLASSG
jgi:hypothetical protein